MLLHLGQDRSVRLDQVEALLDFGLFAKSPSNREFLEVARSERRLDAPAALKAQAVVVTGARVLVSPLSRFTLARRAELIRSGRKTDGTQPNKTGPVKRPARRGNRPTPPP